MNGKLRLNLSHYTSVIIMVYPCIILTLVVLTTFHGCGRMSDERLAQAVEEAMRQSTLRHKAEIVDRLEHSMARVALAELLRLNKAEEEYGKAISFEPIPFHPLQWGFWRKIKREYSSYEIVDMRERGSLMTPYEVVVEYRFRLLQTERQSSRFPEAVDKAKKDTNFLPTGEEGAVDVLYRFDADFEWDRELGKLVGIMGEPLELEQAPDDARKEVKSVAPKIVGWAPRSYFHH